MTDNHQHLFRSTLAMLLDGVARRDAPMHTASVATVGTDGSPQVRTVVVRAVDEDPRISLCLYDAAEKIQIRINARATIHQTDALADERWNRSAHYSRVCYRVGAAPSSTQTTDETVTPLHTDGRENFTVVACHFQSIERLHLRADGHQRCRFDRIGTDWQATWLAP
jgi:pyridoxamine 5'-phosphate oxidase